MKYILLIIIIFSKFSFASNQLNLDLNSINQFIQTQDRLNTISLPSSILGYQIGTFHSRPDQVLRVFETLSEESSRVTLVEYGKSHQKRPLIMAIVSSEKNIQNLDKILKQHQQISKNATNLSINKVTPLPLINYLNYSVHGDEASGTEASILLLYHLASSTSDQVKAMLKDQIIVIDPSLNPDGRARFVNWVNSYRSTNPQRLTLNKEHQQAWPRGRTNKYWFDLNRDWIFASQPESYARMKQFHKLKPHLVLDVHEMGSDSTYFFQPGHPKRNHPLTPKKVFEITRDLATYYKKGLDSIGQAYFSEERFDDFYYGKGSTFSDSQGAVGILFEQASSRGLVRDTKLGPLTYPKTIYNQLITSLSHLEASQKHKKKIQKYYLDFFRNSSLIAKKSTIKGYVISLDQKPDATQKLFKLLQLHQIDVYKLPRKITLNKRTYTPSNAVYIPLNQVQSRFIKSIFDPLLSFEDNIFYDVSSFHIPSHLGIDYAPIFRAFSKSKLKTYQLSKQKEMPLSNTARYYLIESHQKKSFAFIQSLLKQHIAVGVLTEKSRIKTTTETKTFSEGTFVISTEQLRSQTKLSSLIQKAVEKWKGRIFIHATDSANSITGPNLGSPSVQYIKNPVLGILIGTGVQAYSAGYHWHLLDLIYGLDVHLLDVEKLNKNDLSQLNSLILPKGNYSPKLAQKLKEWVEEGGHLITIETASKWAVNENLLPIKIKPAIQISNDIPFSKRLKIRGSHVIGGAHFKVKLDNSHPLAFGYKNHVTTFKQNNIFYDDSRLNQATVGRYTNAPLVSGYISDENINLMKNSAALIAISQKKGAITLFSDSPAFRGIGYATHKLLLNALFFRELY